MMKNGMMKKLFAGILAGTLIFTGVNIDVFAAGLENTEVETVPEEEIPEEDIIEENDNDLVEPESEGTEVTESEEIEEEPAVVEEGDSKELVNPVVELGDSLCSEEHVWDEGTIEQEPSYYDNGSVKYKCQNCDAYYKLYYCNDYYSDDYIISYYAVDNNSYLYSIVIPSTINNVNVVSIDEWAFEDFLRLKSVTISKGIEKIGNGAFYNCDSLQSIYIPSSVTDMDYSFIGVDYNTTGQYVARSGFVLYGNTDVAMNYAKKYKITYKLKFANGDVQPTIKTVKLSATSYTYDGKEKKPSVVVTGTKGEKISSSFYSVSYPSGRKNVGAYTVKVTLKNGYSGTYNLTYKINPPKASLSSVTAGKQSFTAKWTKKSTQVTGYQIQYSTSSTFASGNKTTTISSYKTTSKTVKSLKNNNRYYVRIRTYKKVGKTNFYSAWSGKKTVAIGDVPYYKSSRVYSAKTVSLTEDITRDGKKDTIKLKFTTDSYDSFKNLTFSVNGKSAGSINLSSYDNHVYNIYYIHMTNKREYLIIYGVGDSECSELCNIYSYDSKTKKMAKVKNMFSEYWWYSNGIKGVTKDTFTINMSAQPTVTGMIKYDIVYKVSGDKIVVDSYKNVASDLGTGYISEDDGYGKYFKKSQYVCARSLKFMTTAGGSTTAFTTKKNDVVKITGLSTKNGKIYAKFSNGSKSGWILIDGTGVDYSNIYKWDSEINNYNGYFYGTYERMCS